jgi:hypothetical protein
MLKIENFITQASEKIKHEDSVSLKAFSFVESEIAFCRTNKKKTFLSWLTTFQKKILLHFAS